MNYAQYSIFKHYIGAILCKNLYRTPSKTVCIKHRDHLYIAIKGTSTVKDWKCNFHLKKNADDIHIGFVNYAEECFHELNNQDIIEDIHHYDHIVLSAHSLGACAAVIVLYNLMLNYGFLLEGKQLDVVLFGSPKPGGTEFMREFNDLCLNYDIDIYRYNNKFDAVPTYPPLDGFTHICDEIILDKKNSKRTNLYNDHCLDSYIQNLLDQRLQNNKKLKIHNNKNKFQPPSKKNADHHS